MTALSQLESPVIQPEETDVMLEPDVFVLRALRDLLSENVRGVTATQVLDRARAEEPTLFASHSARAIGAILNRYGLRSQRCGGKRVFTITAGAWKSIEKSYGE